ncbi:hypothetical protein Taro_017947 [Colocasia esculenta]|uniref:Uncharacterized protein n=1 Tax=Colocasia esculenta TaxID=4460 RepID=A0A843USM5_COLES|nr:hypothetical protein [Colocasia esculenta]
MDRANELIQMNKTTYAKWWEIIDRRWEHTLHHDLHTTGHFFNPQYMYRTDGRNEYYDNASEVLIGAKNVIKRILSNEDKAIIACKQMHDYRLQLSHLSELDDVHLLPEFATPPAPKRQRKIVGGRVRNKKHGINIVDLETIEEDNDDETLEPSDNLRYNLERVVLSVEQMEVAEKMEELQDKALMCPAHIMKDYY